jgi:hypothetical protein
MATLNVQDRFDVWADFTRDQRVGTLANMTKADLRAAVDALDDFFNTNAASVNNALPATAKTNMTTPQKALLLMFVISKRYLSGV